MVADDFYSDEATNKVIEIIDGYVTQSFDMETGRVVRIRDHIWRIKEDRYVMNIVVTSLLVVFDAVLYEELPQDKEKFYKDLLQLSAHRAKISKLCLVDGTVHLRIVRGHEDFDFSEFTAHIEEYRDLYPDLKEMLDAKYFKSEPDEATDEAQEESKDAKPEDAEMIHQAPLKDSGE